MKAVYHPQASREIIEQAQYYNAQSLGLGADFIDEIDRAIVGVVERPLMYPVIERDIRRRLVKRFPFSILYRVVGEHVRVLVIRHHARHWDYGMDRD